MDKLSKKELILNNIYLVKYFASKYYIENLNINYEDLLSKGVVGLIKISETHNIKNGINISPSEVNDLKFHILNEVRRASSLNREDVLQVLRQLENTFKKYTVKNLKYDLSYLNEFESIEIDSELKNKSLLILNAYLDIFFDVQGEVKTYHIYNGVNEILKDLSEIEKIILNFYYVHELTYLYIKQVLGLSYKQIYCIHIIALLKIRKLFLRKLI